jgi:hypothetical protein
MKDFQDTRAKTPDKTPLYVRWLREQRNGVFLVTIRGKRIVQVARCRVPFVPPSADVVVDHTQMYLNQMMCKRAGVFVAHLAAGAIVGLGTVDPPPDVSAS